MQNKRYAGNIESSYAQQMNLRDGLYQPINQSTHEPDIQLIYQDDPFSIEIRTSHRDAQL